MNTMYLGYVEVYINEEPFERRTALKIENESRLMAGFRRR